MEEVKLPELGENIDEVEVSAVLVAVGDRVRTDQPLLEVETEKASLEVPATADGTVKKLMVAKGDKVRVGQTIAQLDGVGGGDGAAAESEPEPEPDAEPESAEPDAAAEAEAETGAEDDDDDDPDDDPNDDADSGAVVDFPHPSKRSPDQIGRTAPAAPSTRALARELGVDVNDVPGSGPGGRISRDDVKAYAKRLIRSRRGEGSPAPGPAAAPDLPDFSRWGDVREEPIDNVRRATAAAMSRSWSLIPHVTQFDRADVSQLETMRRKFNQRAGDDGAKLTMTAIIIKMVASALRQFPKFNASLDLAGGRVIYKDYYHVGVAVDTERGLLVPVLRDVDRKGLLQIASELGELAGRARDRKLKPDEMQGACFTVSNLGGLGTTYFSPIVNWPEVAILGVGRAETQAVWDDGQFRPRTVMPLSISYDHRLIDGADAARFLRWLAEALEQPLLLVLDEGPHVRD